VSARTRRRRATTTTRALYPARRDARRSTLDARRSISIGRARRAAPRRRDGASEFSFCCNFVCFGVHRAREFAFVSSRAFAASARGATESDGRLVVPSRAADDRARARDAPHGE
jgi:hypothetical protein